MPTRQNWVMGFAFVGLVALGSSALGQDAHVGSLQQPADSATLEIHVETIPDLKAVYATVESADVVAARARIGGTVASLSADEGDAVIAGAVLAVVVDDRLVPQVRALDARVAALTAEATLAVADRDRARQLLERGVIAQVRFDEAQTRVDIVQGQLDGARQERSGVIQQQREGEILAPTTGIVLGVGITQGSVVVAGEAVAQIASEDYVLRLRLPERHARFLGVGEEVRIDQSALGEAVAEVGVIRKIYPQIVDGRVVADAEVEGLGGYFVGERIRVWVSASERPAILVPPAFIRTTYGVDYVVLLSADQEHHQVPIQRGRTHLDGRIEVLSGLGDGDVILAP